MVNSFWHIFYHLLAGTDQQVNGMPENVLEIPAGQEYIIPSTVPTRPDGYSFQGWKSNINSITSNPETHL